MAPVRELLNAMGSPAPYAANLYVLQSSHIGYLLSIALLFLTKTVHFQALELLSFTAHVPLHLVTSSE